MPNHVRILDLDGTTGLSFECGDLSADEAVSATGHEPNGYFWEGLIR